MRMPVWNTGIHVYLSASMTITEFMLEFLFNVLKKNTCIYIQ